MFGWWCVCDSREVADGGWGSRLGFVSEELSDFSEVRIRWKWLVCVLKDAGISVDVSFLRMFEGFCELGQVPLRVI